MKKIIKTPWDKVDKDGMMLSGFVQANNTIIRKITHTSSAQAALLYIMILSHKNINDNFSFPSIEILAKEMDMSKSSINRMLNELYENEFLEIDSGKMGYSSKYYFPQEKFYQQNENLYKRKKGGFKKQKQKSEEELLQEEAMKKIKKRRRSAFRGSGRPPIIGWELIISRFIDGATRLRNS